ncbi:MAG: pitrilysin family protein [Thermoplasmata archaeon]
MPSNRVPRPRVRRFRLRNGLEVLLAPNPASPTASVWVWYRVGSKNEHPGITGGAHWLEHMLFQGTPKYAKGEIDRAILNVGGLLNAFTDLDYTAYFSTVPREHLDIPIDIEADRMTRALLMPKEVDRERTVVLSEREGNENWPEFRVEEELYELAFRRHPYRWDALGYRTDIEHMGAGDLRDYYRRFYGTRNAVLVVTGGFDPRTVEGDVRRRFSPLPAGGADPTVREIEPPARGERRSTLSGPGTTPLIAIAYRSPAIDEASTPATMLIDVLLGGETRMFSAGSRSRSGEHPGSRLYRSLVDPGLAVRATSEWRARVHPGLFTVYAQASPGVSLDRIEAAIDGALDGLTREGPTAAELNEARTKVRRGAALAYEGATRAGYRLGYFASIRPPGFEDRLYRAILGTPASRIRETARGLFSKDRRVVVRYEPIGGANDD